MGGILSTAPSEIQAAAIIWRSPILPGLRASVLRSERKRDRRPALGRKVGRRQAERHAVAPRRGLVGNRPAQPAQHHVTRRVGSP
jgi:hypothetical protein